MTDRLDMRPTVFLWLPQSPNLTPCDFFQRGHLKANVFSTPVPNQLTLKSRIQVEISEIWKEMLQKVMKIHSCVSTLVLKIMIISLMLFSNKLYITLHGILFASFLYIVLHYMIYYSWVITIWKCKYQFGTARTY